MDSTPVTARLLGRYFIIDGDELERSYKHHLSDYSEWEQRDHVHRETQKRRAQQRKRYRKKHPRKPGVVMRGRPPKRKNERFKAPTYSNGDTKLELLTRSKRALNQSRDKRRVRESDYTNGTIQLPDARCVRSSPQRTPSSPGRTKS